MRQKVIELLQNIGKDPQSEFNDALLLFMQSPTANKSLVRSYNTQGYSEQRFKELVYDLKKEYNVTEAEIVPVQNVENVPTPEPVKPEDTGIKLPEFDKGATGNRQRREFLATHNITAPSTKNADMDAAIKAFLESAEPKENEADVNNIDVVTEDNENAPETEKK